MCVGSAEQPDAGGNNVEFLGYNGQISEVVYYPRFLTDAERLTVEAALKSRRGTP